MSPEAVWEDARTALALYAADPAGLGGIVLHGRAGPVRERLLAMLPGPTRRLPANITDGALLGGLDLAATLGAGRPMQAAGLLADLGCGTLVAPMAERLPASLAARLAARMDGGASFGLVALDESADPEERVPAALTDRLAFYIDIDGLSHRDVAAPKPGAVTAIGADGLRHRDAAPAATPTAVTTFDGDGLSHHDAPSVPAAVTAIDRDDLHHRDGPPAMPGTATTATIPDDLISALCSAAEALGVLPIRAVLLAMRAAAAAAKLAGRTQASAEDAALAARLVLAPRATRIPAGTPDEQSAPEPPPPDTQETGQEQPDSTASLLEAADLVLDAARAAIPAGLLATLATAAARHAPGPAGVAGQRRKGGARGRPIGVRPGQPGGGQRLDFIETLRAAAPWQRLRAPDQPGVFPLRIRRDDLRIVRTQQRARTTTIFLVDASGSSALNRLAEAKGAVELLLAECYRRRDEVAVIAFRGRAAQILLPPTRSLVRAKRSLATLPGGGGTPLAAGIDAGCALALAARRAGATPLVVLLTDGRANVTRAGGAGRAQAGQEALTAARLLRERGIDAVLLDTSPRAAPEAGALASAMGARYVPLPYADAARVVRAINPPA